MGQKRAAKKSARPPPPPPPPAGSSEEEDSRSRSDESEDEAVARTPTPTPSKPLAPPQRAEESDSSDEEEEEEEEEEAPNNPPAPPQKGEESESSDDEEEGDDEEEEPTHLAAPSAPKNQPPPPQQSKESDASDEDGESSESDDEEAPPPPKQAPKRQADAIKPPSAKKARLAFHRIWSTDDEVRILEALAAHQKQHGALPQPDALIGALAGKLDNRAYGSKELQSKLQTLKKRYVVLSSRGELPSKEHDLRLLDLSKIVWGGDKTAPAAAAAEAASGRELKGFDEMCELYPYLAEEVKKLEAAHPGMFKRVFGKMDDGKARAMDDKIKKLRVAQMKVELRRTELTKEVSKAIMELVD
ncbi:nucleolar protein dao-5-like [Lolium rigidum]|uniref:nucleolar protein dao-5-like n=1 Tax=Lolium rigidum TaxID=89674 RepID=UPI001F5C8A4B|nr:nucleolar protein dao-5-like [Lolium rigidum]